MEPFHLLQASMKEARVYCWSSLQVINFEDDNLILQEKINESLIGSVSHNNRQSQSENGIF